MLPGGRQRFEWIEPELGTIEQGVGRQEGVIEVEDAPPRQLGLLQHRAVVVEEEAIEAQEPTND